MILGKQGGIEAQCLIFFDLFNRIGVNRQVGKGGKFLTAGEIALVQHIFLGCGFFGCPLAVIPVQLGILIQLIAAAVGEAEDRTGREDIALSVGISAVEMEGQHDGSIHIFHTDPTDLLYSVGRLTQAAAVLVSSKVGARCIRRQIGIILNQVIGTVAVS